MNHAIFAPDEIAIVQQVVNETNAGIVGGVVDTEVATGETVTVSLPPGAIEAEGSHGGFEVHWYGVELWLDGWATGQLQNLLYGGAGASAIAAELTSWTGIGGLSGGAIAGLLTLGAAGLGVCNWNGNGVGLHVVHLGAAWWCWPR